MREVELKSVVGDLAGARRSVELAGGVLTYEGALVDHRYDDEVHSLAAADQVIRLRTYEREGAKEGHLDWKGPTQYQDGYKVREEVSTTVGDPRAMEAILADLGFRIVRVIERHIVQYSIGGAVVRFERYPRMDILVEVEGDPASIENAIRATGLAREGFSADRLPDFVARYERRTGLRAALSAGELGGDYSYRTEDA